MPFSCQAVFVCCVSCLAGPAGFRGLLASVKFIPQSLLDWVIWSSWLWLLDEGLDAVDDVSVTKGAKICLSENVYLSHVKLR